MITFTRLPGGIGNQLHQYAALLGAGERLGFEVRIPPFSQHRLGRAFRIETEVFTAAEKRRLRHLFHEPRLRYAPDWLSIPDWTDLKGCFSSPRYFPRVATLDRQLTFRDEWLERPLALVDRLRERASSVVGIHVRRGDFLDNAQHASVTDTDYYRRAVEQVEDPDAVFVVASDDLEWCANHFVGGRFVMAEQMGPEEHLALLAHCDQLIIGNSTFSWWGAWLNKTPARRVVAPRVWLRDEHGCAPTHTGLVATIEPWSARRLAEIHRENRSLLFSDDEREPLPEGWTEI